MSFFLKFYLFFLYEYIVKIMGGRPKFQIVSSESVQRALLSHFGYRGECHTEQRPLVVLRCSCRRQTTRPLPPPRRTE